MDSLREQEKPEARKMLENRAASHTSAARIVRKTGREREKLPDAVDENLPDLALWDA